MSAPAALEPRFTHDCKVCEFLGQVLDHDLYYCTSQGPRFPTLVARWGDDGPEYQSGRNVILTTPSGKDVRLVIDRD